MTEINAFLIRGFEIINIIMAGIVAIIIGLFTYGAIRPGFSYNEGGLPFLIALFVGVVSGVAYGGLCATFIETRKELSKIRHKLDAKDFNSQNNVGALSSGSERSVGTGFIGSRNQYAYEKSSDGKFKITHPSGFKKIFESEAEAIAWFSKFQS